MKFNELNQVADEYNLGGNGGDWMKLQKGDNRIRVVSEYEALAKHFSADRKTPPTICVGAKNGCSICAQMHEYTEAHKEDEKKTSNPFKPTVKFLMWVIDRLDGKFKIIEAGWTVVAAIRDLGEDAEYKFDPETNLPPYDLNVKKTVLNPTPSGTEYSVIANRQNTPLTPEELAAIPALKPIKEIVDTIKAKALVSPAAAADAAKAPF